MSDREADQAIADVSTDNGELLEGWENAKLGEVTAKVGSGATPKGQILSFSIPWPPQAEQKRIVAQVESLLSTASAARQRLAKVPSLLARLRQSVLAAACSGQLTADWREGHPDVEAGGLALQRVLGNRREDWNSTRKYKEPCDPVFQDLPNLPTT